MKQAEALYQLQQVDLQIVKQQKRLDEIAAQLGDRQPIDAAQLTVTQANQQIAPLRTQTRDLDLELKSVQQKAQQSEQQLYSGSVKNPKAMQEMQQEIEALKRRSNELEERLLDVMMQSDDAQTALDQAEAALTQTTQQWETAHEGLLQEQAQLQQSIQQLQQNRQEALKPVQPDSLKQYNALRPRKANQPVSVLKGVSCSVCGIEQTMNVVQAVQRGDQLIPCTNCGRILVDRF
jgi:predicted  nucleic acid-binding Zn-ribbon protein